VRISAWLWQTIDTQVTKPASQISLPLPEDAASATPPEAVASTGPATIDFKGISLPVMQVALSRLEPEQIAAAIKTRFGKNASTFFDNDAAVLDLSKVEAETADWAAVREQLAGAGLQLVAVYGGNAELQASARSAGLAVIDAPPVARAPKAKEEVPVVTEVVAEPAPVVAEATPAPAPTAPSARASEAPAAATMVIDKPLRSGQRIYARGGDLVVLAMVSAGAEVIADGNIHIYAPLRGRALAGAQGDQKARIFTTSFEAELVSIAGVYRTFESPQQFGKLAGQPVQVSLVADESKPDAEPKLNVASLSTR
jgi:septum site-determining protein MinC